MTFPRPITPAIVTTAVAISNPTMVGSLTTSTNVTAGISFATTNSITAGNLVLVAVSFRTSGSPTSVSAVSDGTNTYTKAVGTSVAVGDSTIENWYKENASGVAGGATLTVSASGAASSLAQVTVIQVAGILSSGSSDQSVTATGAAVTTINDSTGTLASSNEILISNCIRRSTGGAAATYTQAPGFSNLITYTDLGGAGGSLKAVLDYKIVAATTAITYTPTFNLNGSIGAAVSAFKGN